VTAAASFTVMVLLGQPKTWMTGTAITTTLLFWVFVAVGVWADLKLCLGRLLRRGGRVPPVWSHYRPARYIWWVSSAVLFASIPATMALHGPLHLWFLGVYVCALLLIRLGEVFVLALPRAVRSRHKLPTRMRKWPEPAPHRRDRRATTLRHRTTGTHPIRGRRDRGQGDPAAAEHPAGELTWPTSAKVSTLDAWKYFPRRHPCYPPRPPQQPHRHQNRPRPRARHEPAAFTATTGPLPGRREVSAEPGWPANRLSCCPSPSFTLHQLGAPAMASIANKLDKAYESKPVEELAAAPVTALQGVSDGDAEHLKAALGIVTVADLGTNKFFLWAQAITKLAE